MVEEILKEQGTGHQWSGTDKVRNWSSVIFYSISGVVPEDKSSEQDPL